eukprot:TRINITY_DN12465_c0_g1_i2.p2 TRINITY_DN12465_c0_g1~~TRINITY_DN12465_c0_g1_i2.p2  ORF type:complete len:106 (+),score=17.50 TRINITY_DN12465_c0_g1_i2:183-500(+)
MENHTGTNQSEMLSVEAQELLNPAPKEAERSNTTVLKKASCSMTSIDKILQTRSQSMQETAGSNKTRSHLQTCYCLPHSLPAKRNHSKSQNNPKKSHRTYRKMWK